MEFKRKTMAPMWASQWEKVSQREMIRSVFASVFASMANGKEKERDMII